MNKLIALMIFCQVVMIILFGLMVLIYLDIDRGVTSLIDQKIPEVESLISNACQESLELHLSVNHQLPEPLEIPEFIDDRPVMQPATDETILEWTLSPIDAEPIPEPIVPVCLKFEWFFDNKVCVLWQ